MSWVEKWHRALDEDDSPLSLLAMATEAEDRGHTLWPDACSRLIAAGKRPYYNMYLSGSGSKSEVWAWVVRPHPTWGDNPEILPPRVFAKLLAYSPGRGLVTYKTKHEAWLDAIEALVQAEANLGTKLL